MAITNIYKGALERSDIDKIYKGTTLLYEKVLAPQSETWLINESLIGVEGINENITFISNAEQYSLFNYDWLNLLYDSTKVYNGKNAIWSNQAYRAVYFSIPPTGDLLTWLQANAVKQ